LKKNEDVVKRRKGITGGVLPGNTALIYNITDVKKHSVQPKRIGKKKRKHDTLTVGLEEH